MGVHAVRHEKSQADVEKVEQFICDGALGNLRRGEHGDTYRQLRNVGRADGDGPSERLDRSGILPERPRPRPRCNIPTQACAWVDPTDQATVVGLGYEARDKSTMGTPVTDTEATEGWFGGEMVELTDVHLGDGDWIRSLTY